MTLQSYVEQLKSILEEWRDHIDSTAEPTLREEGLREIQLLTHKQISVRNH